MAAVYITGASAGLGRAVAKRFAEAGYACGLIARDSQALAETTASLMTQAAWANADVADYGALATAAARLEEHIGPPDIWINAAMATIFARFDEIAPEEFRRAIDVTLLGSVHGLQLAVRSMKPRRRGHIIQIGSALAYRAIPLQAPYCAAKLGIRGAVDSLRCELMHDEIPITVTMVHMPAMNTPQFDWARRHIAEHPQPVPPIYSPECCAEAVLWAVRHPSRREVWVGKPTVEAILGNKIFPALLDHYIARHGFESQFEAPAGNKDTDGNLFRTVAAFHHTEGHFAPRQKSHVSWIGTSSVSELGVLAIGLLIIVGLILI
jgi:NAD(P)-dependent dehydrogenase (short-subunit alcohol dehydrogenase family)